MFLNVVFSLSFCIIFKLQKSLDKYIYRSIPELKFTKQ